jgi:hypothetical protein
MKWARGILCLWVIFASSSAFGSVELKGDLYDGNGGPLTAGTYYINSEVRVPADRTLTIQPGAILKFRWNKLVVYGTMNATGTTAQRIQFTSWNDNTVGEVLSNSTGQPQGGDWPRLHYESGSAGSVAFARFAYGGNWPGGTRTNVLVLDSPAHIADSLFENNLNSAVLLRADAVLERLTIRDTAGSNESTGSAIEIDGIVHAAITGCTLGNNAGAAIYLKDPTNLLTCQYSNLTAYGNAVNALQVSGTISKSGTISVTTLPIYPWWDLWVGSDDPAEQDVVVNVDPGVIFKMQDRPVRVAANDELNLNGTITSPIVFTSSRDDTIGGDTRSDGAQTSPAPGQWSKVAYEEGSRGKISHVRMQYGGCYSGGTNVDMLEVRGIQLSITDSTFEFSKNDGIALYGGTYLLTRVVSQKNAGNGLYLDSIDLRNGLTTFTEGNLTDNGGDGIHIRGAHALTARLLTIRGNGYWGMNAQTAGEVFLREGAIFENAGGGVRNLNDTPCVDARFNFWGDPSGPLDGSDAQDCVAARGFRYHNPAGKGNKVTNAVIYDPWSRALTPCACPDADGDGVPDSWDDCPNTPQGAAINRSGCPVSTLDRDGDGKFGLAEVIYILQIVAGFRAP